MTQRRVWLAMMLAIGMVLDGSAQADEPHWPSFRGPGATGVADGQNPPTSWDVENGTNIKWKTPIPGLAHSSPIVWGDQVFVTSAVSSNKDPYLKVGLYGESPDHPEDIEHDFRLYAMDLNSGKILWQKSAEKAIPKVKRHIKSSHANCTPATDGKHVVAFFGSEGLYCYSMKGEQLWKKDLGYLDAGAFNQPETQWAFASSPIIHEGKVIVQCDVNNESFIASFDVASGKEVWRTPRESFPCWGTPTVWTTPGRKQIVVNGYTNMGGYEFSTGKELWRLSGGGDVPVPTPYVAHDLVFITNAHGPLRPIYAIRPNATGDISLKGDESSNAYIAWSRPRRGSYIPTTIVYGEYLYVCDDRGILTCYDAKSGGQKYRRRISTNKGEAYSASPVAAGGHIYFSSEEGDIRVMKAGPTYAVPKLNNMGELCLATPAIAKDMLLVRTNKHLFAIGQ